MKNILVILSLFLLTCNPYEPKPELPKQIPIQKEVSPDKVNLDYVNWMTFDSTTLFRAKAKNLPIAVYVYENTCSVCLKMKQETLKDKEIINILNNKFIAARLNVEDDPEVAGILLNYKNSIPAVAFISPGGNLMATIHGYYSTDMLEKAFELILKAVNYSEVENLNESL